jgi:hypothetical protein
MARKSSLLWAIPPLIMVICGIILAVYYIQVSALERNIFQSLTGKISQQIETQFEGFVEPITNNLRIARQWGEEGALNLGEAASLDSRFIPVLEQVPPISAISIADSRGRAYFLGRDGDQWVTRLTDVEKGESKTFSMNRGMPPKPTGEKTGKTDYDPRTRPWFEGAIKFNADETPYWTKPYSFQTQKQFGVTASLKWEDGKKPPTINVVAFDVLLTAISDWTKKLAIGDQGKAFLLTGDGLILGLPNDDRFENADAEKAAILSPVEDLGIPSVSEAFSGWKRTGGDSREPFEYDVENTRWWAEFRPIWLENRTVWLGISLPEEELFRRIGVPRHVVPAAIVIIGLIAFIGSVFVVRRHAGQLQALTIEHERLSGDAAHQTQITDESAEEVLALIEKGESEKLEFKSTARWNLRTDKPGKEIELAWLKGVVGFLNTGGGVLLIGVDDNGEVTGIAADNFQNEDKYLRHIDNLINQHIGPEYLQFIRYGLVGIRGEKVVMIRCARSNDPAFLRNNKEEDFYVRTGPASRKLTPSQILKYLEARHKG